MNQNTQLKFLEYLEKIARGLENYQKIKERYYFSKEGHVFR